MLLLGSHYDTDLLNKKQKSFHQIWERKGSRARMEHVGNKFIYSVNVSRENNKPINRPNENKPCLERPSQRLNEKEEQGLAVFLGLLLGLLSTTVPYRTHPGAQISKLLNVNPGNPGPCK